MMTRQEIESLINLLRKFNESTGENIVEMEMKVIRYAASTPLFQVREGIFMDDKMAFE